MKSSIDVRKVDLEVGPKSPSQASPADSESSKTGLLPSTQLNALETVDLEDKVKSLVGYDPLRDRKRLEKYEIIRLLATGGMGAVYKAFDHKLRRNVALKVMLPTAASNMRARDRFLQEARAAARISSDHVVEIYEADEIDNIPFIAQKYLHGNTLDRYLTLKVAYRSVRPYASFAKHLSDCWRRTKSGWFTAISNPLISGWKLPKDA